MRYRVISIHRVNDFLRKGWKLQGGPITEGQAMYREKDMWLTFDVALKYLKKGLYIRRIVWRDHFITMEDKRIRQYKDSCNQMFNSDDYVIKEDPGIVWNPLCEDLLAEDWLIE